MVVADSRSSNARLLAVGFAVLVVGVLLVLVIIRNADDPAATPADVQTETSDGTGEAPADDETPLTPEQLSTARLPLPLEVPDGQEAVAVRASFMRSVAAIPTPGDLVNVYRLPSTPAEQDAPPVDATGDELPDPGPDAEQVLTEVEVLAVTGPLPASNDGTLTLVVAVPEGDVAGLMPLADTNQVWFTLLPAPEDDASEGPTETPS